MIQRTEIADNQVRVFLTGSIYIEEAKLIQEKIMGYIEQGHKRFSLDLSEVDYIDSSGLGVFISIKKQALKRGGCIEICGITGMVKELFDLTRLTKVFGIE